MQKRKMIIALLGALAAIEHGEVFAASGTAGVSLAAGDVYTLGSGSTFKVTTGKYAFNVNGTATINNSGTVLQTSGGRGIRDNAAGLTLTVNNYAGALIETSDADVIQMSFPANNVVFNNWGTLQSDNASAGGAQAIDFNGITTGSNILNNYATGVITASEADAVRPGVNGVVNNDGLIKSTTMTGSSSDGIDAQANSGITIVNATTGSATVAGTGIIEGARHGITGGVTLKDEPNSDGTYTLNVTNNKGGTIQGDDGSGINIDGFNGKEVVTIVNHGTITGNGVTGDGDGVDVDGIVNLTNTGTIRSLNSYADVSEGVTVGGGTIFNSGTIEGSNSAINPDGSANVQSDGSAATGRGITLAGIDKDSATSDPISPQGIYADTSVTNSGLIKGDSDSGIAVTGAATAYKLTITNLEGGVIEGGGTAAAISTGAQDSTIVNYGTITADTSGRAIDLGSGNSTLEILGGAATVNGSINGGTGTSALIITPGSGNTFSYSGNISNFASVSIGAGTTALYGVGSYTADTSLTDGTLVVGNSHAIGSGTLKTAGASTVQYANGIVLANAIQLDGATSFTVAGSDVATQGGAISGANGFAKRGTGTLILGGANTFTGDTNVDAGTLQLGTSSASTASLAGNALVASGATLSGYGTIAGNLTNAGTVSAASGGGTLSVGGNYAQSANATLLIGVGDNTVATGNASTDSGYGRLVVNGTANIASGSSVALAKTGSYQFAAGQRFVVVDAAASGTHYNERTLNYSASGYSGLMFGTAVDNNGRSDLVVSLAGAATPNLAATSNANSALSGLTSYSGVSNAALLNLYNAATALSLGSSSDATRAGAQLGPAAQASVARAAGQSTLGALDVVSAHADSMRVAQANGTSGASGIATGDAPPAWGVWGQAFGGHAGQGATDGVDGYSANYGGLVLGVDHAIGERWRAGGVFTYSNTAVNNTDNTAGDTSRVNGYGLIGYASFAGEPWYVNVSAGAVLQRYDTVRQVNFAGFSGTANGQFNGQQYVASGEFGWPLALGGVTMTPLASIAYSYLRQNAYTESGGNGAALSIGATHTNSVRSNLGARLEKAFSTKVGQVVPYVQVQWTHEYDHAKATTGASFAGDTLGETAFTTVGATPVTDLADIAIGATLLRSNNLSLTARYELQAGSHFTSQTGSLKLRQLF